MDLSLSNLNESIQHSKDSLLNLHYSHRVHPKYQYNYLNYFVQFLDHGMMGINFHDVFISSIRVSLSQSGNLINSFSIWCWAAYIGNYYNWVIDQTQRYSHIFDIVTQLFLSIVDQRLEFTFQKFGLFSQLISFVRLFKIVSSYIDNFESIVLSEH